MGLDSVGLLVKVGGMACMPQPCLQLCLVNGFELCIVGIVQRLPALTDGLLPGMYSLLPGGGRLAIPLRTSSLGPRSQALHLRAVDGMRRDLRERPTPCRPWVLYSRRVVPDAPESKPGRVELPAPRPQAP